MSTSRVFFTAAALLPLLAACSSSSLLGGGSSEPEPYVAQGSNLTMPPDLALPEPGSGGTRAASVAANDDPNAIPDTGEDFADAPAAQPKKAVAAQPQQDVYAKYGISKTRADGTAKTEGDLYDELRKAQLAEKRRKKPGYGTVFNMGDMFNDN